MIKNPLTYEIMTPQSVGLSGSSITIGKLSGRKGLATKLAELGYELEGEALDAIYRQAIELADEKKEVTDDDLVALVEQRVAEVPQAVALQGWNVTSSHGGKATGMVALVRRRRRSTPRPRSATGRSTRCSRPSTRRCSRSSAGTRCSRPTRSRPSPAARTPRAGCWCAAAARPIPGPGALVVSGHGLSTNIIEASIEAYLVAVNKLHGARPAGRPPPAFVGQRTAADLP